MGLIKRRVGILPTREEIHTGARDWVDGGKSVFPHQGTMPAEPFSLPHVKKGERLVVVAGGTGEVASSIEHDNITFTDYNPEIVAQAKDVFRRKGKVAEFKPADGFRIHQEVPGADWIFDFEAYPLRYKPNYFLELLKSKKGFFLADGKHYGLNKRYGTLAKAYGAGYDLRPVGGEGADQILLHSFRTGEKVRAKAEADESVLSALNSAKKRGKVDIAAVRRELGMGRLDFSASLRRLDKLVRISRSRDYFEV